MNIAAQWANTIDLNTRRGQVLTGLLLTVMAGLSVWALPHPLLLPVLAILPLCVLLVFKFPVWVCLAFILFSFFRLHEAMPVLNPLKIPQLLALASFSVLGWHIFISGKIRVYWSSQLSLYLGFFMLVAIGALLATNRGLAIGALTGTYIKILVMVWAIAWLVRKPQDFALASTLILLAGGCIAIIAIYNRLNGIGLVEGTRVTIGRDIGSMIGDPNDLSLVLTFPLSFAAARLFDRQSPWTPRLFALIVYLLIAWAILCTQSRGGLLGMTAVTGILLWHNSRNKVAVIMIGLVGLVVLVGLAGISERASGGAAEDGIDESAMGRIYAWQAAFNMALAHPLFGVGIDNFYSNYFFYSPHWDGKNHAVHSTWFQVLAETGFIGIIVFISLIVSAFRLVLRSLARVRLNPDADPAIRIMCYSLLSGLTGFCVSGTFLTQGFIWPFYILLALSIALDQFLNESSIEQNH